MIRRIGRRRNKDVVLIIVLGTLLLFLGGRGIRAQSVASSVQGTVKDASGAVIPGADVTLTNINTGTRLITRTDDVGSYAFPSIVVGSYSLSVSKQGFQTYRLSDFEIVVGERATENATLQIGATTQEVTVRGGGLANLLQPESNDLGNIIEPQSVAELPLNGRNFLQLGLLSGATQSNGDNGRGGQGIGQTGHSGLSIDIGGNEPDFSMYLINGMQTFGSRVGNTSLNLSVGAIQEFEVHYGFFMPDLGPEPGIVNVITKSGSNTFHGEAFDFLRNDNLDARDFFSLGPPAAFHRNQFGGDVGGPVRKNKIFFFADYEGVRQDLSGFQGAYAPTKAMFNGDFSALSAAIYNPFSFDLTTGLRQAFAGNIIPSDMINPVAKKLLAFYSPGSSLAEKPINVSGNPRTTFRDNQFTVRVDDNLSARNTIYGEFTRDDSPALQSGLFPFQGISFPLNTKLAMVSVTSILSPNKVNELRLGWTRNSVFSEGQSLPGIQNQLGVTGTGDVNGVPGIGINGYSGFGQAAGLLGDIDNVYQIHDALSWLRGNHQIKLGGDLNYTRSVQSSANANSRGSFNFTNEFTAQLMKNSQGQLVTVPGTGNPFADFLLGIPTNGIAKNMPPTHFRWTTFEPYIQDSWRIRPGLTANLGLAWYVETPPNPSGPDRKLPHAFDFNSGRVLFAALGQINPEIYSTTWSNLAPRVGLAWQPRFSKNTVVRAGWGIYYSTQGEINVQYGIVAPPITISNSVPNTEPLPTYLLGKNAFPPATVGVITPQQAQHLTGNLFDMSTRKRTPYIEQWDFDIAHTFGARYFMDVAYIGSQSHFLNELSDANDVCSAATLTCDAASNPFPQFPFITYQSNDANADYHALVVKFRRQFSNGLSILTNYTWSKTLTNGVGGAISTSNQVASCRKCDKGMADFDVPQSLVISAVWDLPVGQGRRLMSNINPVLNAAVGGWALDFIATFQGGNPFTVTAPNFTAFDARNVRADRICDGRSNLSNKDLRTNSLFYLNPVCFTQPELNHLGNSGHNILTGPGLNNWDIGGHKDFSIRESARLQFRTEFFNAFNHAQFGNPNTNVVSPNFGKVSSTQHAPREIQLALRLVF